MHYDGAVQYASHVLQVEVTCTARVPASSTAPYPEPYFSSDDKPLAFTVGSGAVSTGTQARVLLAHIV